MVKIVDLSLTGALIVGAVVGLAIVLCWKKCRRFMRRTSSLPEENGLGQVRMSLLRETMETNDTANHDVHMKIISSSSALVSNDGIGSSANEAVNGQSTDVIRINRAITEVNCVE